MRGSFAMTFNVVRKLIFPACCLLLLAVSPLCADELAKEIALGKKVAAEVEQKWERVTDPARTARLGMLLARLLPHTTRPLPFEARIVREDMINAFSLPGGIVYFTTGMLDFLRTDAEIAAILAHELVHADRRHVMIQTARSSKISLAALALMIATQGATGPMIMTSLAQVAVTNSYSKDLEREADKEGFRMLVAAGFPPAAMVTSLEAMIFDQLKHPYVDPGVFMTHPELSERVDYILKMADEMNVPIQRKRALGLLRPAVAESATHLVLTLDGAEIWRSNKTDEGAALLRKAVETIDAFLQMETPPYEIQVLDLDGKGALRIGPALVAREPLPEGVPPLGELRASLVQALGDALDKHRSAKYHR
jgi:predicted Zn-dependent protease